MKIYKFTDGRELKYNEVTESEARELTFANKIFKVNLPSSDENFITGNGEGIWACATNESDYEKATSDNSKGELIIVKILNEPIYYDKLHIFDYVVAETRGENRAVAIYSELTSKYGKSRRDEIFK